MPILPIIEVPHPTLAKDARPVREDEFGPELEEHLASMAETMYAAPGVGLAGPQVNDSRRILVIDPGNDSVDNSDNPDQTQLLAIVNPEIKRRSRETVMWEESCLSLPEFYVKVKRFVSIDVSWQDAMGHHHSKTFDGFSAIVLQHEMDHLEGITLLQKSSRLKRSRYLAKKKKDNFTQ